MRTIRVTLVALCVVAAFAACKTGGGYLHTAPTPVLAP